MTAQRLAVGVLVSGRAPAGLRSPSQPFSPFREFSTDGCSYGFHNAFWGVVAPLSFFFRATLAYVRIGEQVSARDTD